VTFRDAVGTNHAGIRGSNPYIGPGSQRFEAFREGRPTIAFRPGTFAVEWDWADFP
jgi:hypothetical protein